ncbi:unnamed protein product [Trichogramma brassicae]|uniref:Uncharacterized protein n=1 Tax=Trichogramma brassicae TaxID=86971 RepID=A0A6H5IY07_9HYME|nr:unnamed protein product [Trichogramma brassicae]
MLEQNIIRPSESPYSSPTWVIQKKNQELTVSRVDTLIYASQRVDASRRVALSERVTKPVAMADSKRSARPDTQFRGPQKQPTQALCQCCQLCSSFRCSDIEGCCEDVKLRPSGSINPPTCMSSCNLWLLQHFARERKDARPEPPPSTITFQEYIAAAKELQIHQWILLHLADRRLRSYLRAAPTPPPSPKRSAPASRPQSAAQPADPSGSPPPVWRLIRLDTPPPPRKPRLDPRLLPTDPRRYRVPLDGAQTPPLPEEIEREQRRKATHHQLALFLAKHPQPVSSAPKKLAPAKLSLLRKQNKYSSSTGTPSLKIIVCYRTTKTLRLRSCHVGRQGPTSDAARDNKSDEHSSSVTAVSVHQATMRHLARTAPPL